MMMDDGLRDAFQNSFVVTVVPPPSPKKTVISSHHIRQKLSPTSHDSSKNQLRVSMMEPGCWLSAMAAGATLSAPSSTELGQECMRAG